MTLGFWASLCTKNRSIAQKSCRKEMAGGMGDRVSKWTGTYTLGIPHLQQPTMASVGHSSCRIGHSRHQDPALPHNHCFNYFRNLKSGTWITSFRVWQGKKATGEITHLEPRGGQLTTWAEV